HAVSLWLSLHDALPISFGEEAVVALRGRSEQKLHRRPENRPQHQSRRHLGVAPRVPDTPPPRGRQAKQARQLPPPHLRKVVRQRSEEHTSELQSRENLV